MVSTDLTSISDDALGILLNERIIALNVSEECLDVDFELTPYSKTHLENLSTSSDDMQTTMMSWSGPLSDGSTVVGKCLYSCCDSVNPQTTRSRHQLPDQRYTLLDIPVSRYRPLLCEGQDLITGNSLGTLTTSSVLSIFPS